MRFGGMFSGIIERFRAFMVGRYGNDSLNFAIMIVGCVFTLIFSFVRTPYLWVALLLRTLSYAPYIIAIFRIFSKNIPARQRENQRFLRFAAPWKKFFMQKLSQKQDSTHKYYHCPKCHNVLRVPKGRGKIKISCPHCKKEFVKNTGKQM